MRRFILCGLILSCVVTSWSQTRYTRHEIGIQTGFALSDSSTEGSLVDLGARYTINLNNTLSIDSQFDFYPQETLPMANRGGRQFTYFTGLKAGIRRRRFGLFGKMRPGLRHYSAIGVTSEVPNVTEARTHYALDLGGVLELYAGKRWIVRFDGGEILTRLGDHVDFRILGTDGTVVALFIATPRIAQSFSANIGVSYRIGSDRYVGNGDFADEVRKTRMQAGIQYSMLNIARFEGQEMHDQHGVGGWFSYFINSHLAIDSALTYFPQDPGSITSQEGGTILQGLFGVKTGLAARRFGVFARVRPGFGRFSKTLTDYTTLHDPVPNLQFHPATQLAIDAGGTFEYYPSGRLVFRFDLGDTTIHYFDRPILTTLGPVTVTSFTDSTIQMSVGFGVRF